MKQFVLAAGVDYEFKGVDFRVLADSRRRWLEKQNTKKDELRFTTMDVRSGEIEVRNITFPSGKRVELVRSTKPHTTVTRASFVTAGGHTRFKSNQPGVMGITDIYLQVIEIGTATPGTLMELSIFSHGWMGGPILVNSADDRLREITIPIPGGAPIVMAVPVAGNNRDPDDKDGRARLDFQPPTMDATDLAGFRAAFHADGFSWLWGCSFPRVIHHTLWAMERARGYASSGLSEDKVLTLNDVTAEDVSSLEDMLFRLLGTFPSRNTVTLKFGFLRWYFCKETQGSYAASLAAGSDRAVRAALLGTYAQYDTGGDQMMNVPASFVGHFAFYENYLGLPQDPEGRRYGVHQPARVCGAPPTP